MFILALHDAFFQKGFFVDYQITEVATSVPAYGTCFQNWDLCIIAHSWFLLLYSENLLAIL